MTLLNPFQSVVTLDDIPDEKLRDVVHAILEHLDLEIVEESTPDYTVYEVRGRRVESLGDLARQIHVAAIGGSRMTDNAYDTNAMALSEQQKVGPIYVASRASVPERSAMWRDLRDRGWQITSTWIDEAGEGQTADYTELWDRIEREIAAANKVVLYAEQDDFPLKGAILEAGIALGMGKPVIVCLPGVKLDGRTLRPIGSWLAHRSVIRVDWLPDAMRYHNFVRPCAVRASSMPSEEEIVRAICVDDMNGTPCRCADDPGRQRVGFCERRLSNARAVLALSPKGMDQPTNAMAPEVKP